MISRRSFLKYTAGALGAGITAHRVEALNGGTATFDLHPFIDAHPEAVFIMRTDVRNKTDHVAVRRAGLEFGRNVFVIKDTGGVPPDAVIPVKPNMKTSSSGKLSMDDLIGMGTDPFFVEGVLGALKEKGVDPRRFRLREVNRPEGWSDFGHVDMAERVGADIRLDLAPEVSKLVEGRDYTWTDVPEGIWYKKIPHLEPVNTPGSWLLNIAKFKGHGMGLSLCCKNIQGTVAHNYQQFCCRHDEEMRIDPAHMHANAKEAIAASHRRHVEQGIPRWDKPGPYGGIWQETWAARTLDHLSVTPCGFSVIEGIYARDGNGSTSGPHPLDREHEYNESRAHSKTGLPQDYMSNIVIFGRDPFRTDIIGNWLGGQEPGNFGLFHLAVERGLLTVVDPFDIPVYVWENGAARLTPLESLERTPLVNYYLTRNFNGAKESMYHLCDEPFDYSAMEGTSPPRKPGKPAVFALADGTGSYPGSSLPIEFRLHGEGQVRVEVRDGKSRYNRILSEGRYSAGSHMTLWNTTDATPGDYSIVLSGEGSEVSSRIKLR